MKDYSLYLFDLDGTLFRGSEPLPHAVETVNELRSREKQVRFATNNSSQTRESLTEKLNSLGFRVTVDEVYGSAWAAGEWCRQNAVQSAFVIGERGLVESLTRVGVGHVTIDANAVIVGICRHLTYEMIDIALQNIVRGAKFIATNRDATYPLEKGRVQPGAGAMVAAVEATAGVAPIVLGKPSPFLFETILGAAGILSSDALVIGDRIDTDIAAGRAAGCDTLLVLTGVTTDIPPGQAHAHDLRALL